MVIRTLPQNRGWTLRICHTMTTPLLRSVVHRHLQTQLPGMVAPLMVASWTHVVHEKERNGRTWFTGTRCPHSESNLSLVSEPCVVTAGGRVFKDDIPTLRSVIKQIKKGQSCTKKRHCTRKAKIHKLRSELSLMAQTRRLVQCQ
jgi:electron transfer flavoprotein alpha/beta subunit